MANLTKVNKAIDELIVSVKNTTIKELSEYLAKNLTNISNLEEIIAQYIETAKAEDVVAKKSKGKESNNDKPKKTREPTEYNIFLKNKMAEIKEAGTELKGKDLMIAAIAEWKKLHPPVEKEKEASGSGSKPAKK